MIDRINGEPVELVTRFSSLKTGDVVYIQPVTCCARPYHRGMLGHFRGSDLIGDSNGGWDLAATFEMLPYPACKPPSFLRSGISHHHVAAKVLYRVINPPLASDDAAENASLDRKRLRKALAR